MPNDPLIVKEAAKLLKVTPRQVRHLIDRKLIKARWTGSSYLVDLAEVQRYAKVRRGPGRPSRQARARKHS